MAGLLVAGCSSGPNKRKLGYLRDGEKYAKAGKYREAVIQFRNALEVDLRLAAAHYGLGCAYMALKSSEPAYRELLEATTLGPSNSDAQVRLAALLLGRGQLDQAQSSAEKVLAADPANLAAHASLGEKYTLGREFSKAIEEFRTLVELDPHRVESYSALGAAYAGLAARTGNPEEELRLAEKAQETSPHLPSAFLARAQALPSKGDFRQARIVLQDGLASDRSSLPFLATLVNLDVREGRATDSIQRLTGLIQQDPRNAGVTSFADWHTSPSRTWTDRRPTSSRRCNWIQKRMTAILC